MEGGTTRKSLIVGFSLSPTDSKRSIPLTLQDEHPWTELQQRLKITRGLPIKSTEVGEKGAKQDQQSLLNEARVLGFRLEVLVHPSLHRYGFGDATWEIEDAESWMHLLSLLPSNNTQAIALLVDHCFAKFTKGDNFIQRLEGSHGIWELSVLCADHATNQVFSDSQIKLMISELGMALKGLTADRVGKSTSGCALAAALWWLLFTPKAQLSPLRAKDGSIVEEEESSDDEDGRHKGHRAHMRVKHLPSSKLVLHSMLKNKLMGTAAALLRDLVKLVAGKGGRKMRHSLRLEHTALLAAWGAELLRYALSVSFVKSTLEHACAALIEPEYRGGAFSMAGGGNKKGSTNEKGAPPTLKKDIGTKADGGGEEESTKAPSSQQAELDLVGIDPDTLWNTLLMAASLPAWIRADVGATFLIFPMSYHDALRVIQSHYRAHSAKKEKAAAKERLKNAMLRDKKSQLFRRNARDISDTDRNTWALALAKVAKSIPVGHDAALEGLKSYFDYPHQCCPSVSAAECLVSALLTCDKQQEHFMGFAELPQLLMLLDDQLPLRTQHMACVVLSMFFRSPLRVGLAAWLPGGRKSDGSCTAHDLLPRLVYLAALEPAEQEARYGDWQRTHNEHPTKIINAYVPPLLKDVRWGRHGSEVSVHAATCVWGCAKLLAAESVLTARRVGGMAANSLEAQLEEALADGFAFSGAPASFLGKFEKSVQLLLSMVDTGVRSRRGPAAHILASSLQVMAYQRECIPILLKLGLVDYGDPKTDANGMGRGRSVPRTMQLAASCKGGAAADTPRWGSVRHPSGLLGVLTDSEVPGHVMCAATTIALIAMSHASAKLEGTQEAAAAAAAPVRAGPATPRGKQQGAAAVKENWSQRLLAAGAWPNLVACLGVLPECIELQQVVSVGMMYLAHEVALYYQQMLEDRRRPASRSQSPRRVESPRRTQSPRRASSPTKATQGPALDKEALGLGLSVHPSPSPSGVNISVDSREGRSPGLWLDLEGLQAGDAGGSVFDGGPDMAPIYHMLLQGKFSKFEGGVQVLAQLLKSPDMNVVEFAAMATFHLASIPSLKEPLGEVNVIASLVAYVRRWVDMVPVEQYNQRHSAEWVMVALKQMVEGSEGVRNVERFSNAWKTVDTDKPEDAILEMHGFGYSVTVVPGQVSVKQGETEVDLLERTLWSGFGWGRGQVSTPSQSDPSMLASNGHKMGKRARDVSATAVGHEAGGGGGTEHSLGGDSSVGEGQNAKHVYSAIDPVELLVQVVDTHSMRKTGLLNIKLPALIILRIVSSVRDNRIRLVSAGAGSQLAQVAQSSTYDSKTRAAASALWLEISETQEGQDPRWWVCMKDGNKEGEKAEDDIESLTLDRIDAQSSMQIKMLRSKEADQEAVGARGAAALMCKGDAAKRVFYDLGGLSALLDVASSPNVELRVLAPACLSLLNLSSYVPIQVAMCARSLRLLLHINSKYAGFNGYTGEKEGPVARHSGVEEIPNFLRPFFLPKNKEGLEQQPWHQMVKDVLFGSSGALSNLSRHPDNRNAFYRMELEVKTRTAAVGVLADPGCHAQPSVEGTIVTAMQRIPLNKVPPPLLTAHALNEAEYELLQTIIQQPLFTRADSPNHNSCPSEIVSTGLLSHQASVQTYGGAISTRTSLAVSIMEPQQSIPDVAWALSQHRHLGIGPAKAAAATAASGQLPALYALRRQLAQPTSTMWAPILVDSHDGPPPALFDVLPGTTGGITGGTKDGKVVDDRCGCGSGGGGGGGSGDGGAVQMGSSVSPSGQQRSMSVSANAHRHSKPLRPTARSSDGPIQVHKRDAHSTRWSPNVVSIDALTTEEAAATAAAVTPTTRSSAKCRRSSSNVDGHAAAAAAADQPLHQNLRINLLDSTHRTTAVVHGFQPAFPTAAAGPPYKCADAPSSDPSTPLSPRTPDRHESKPARAALSMAEQVQQLLTSSGLRRQKSTASLRSRPSTAAAAPHSALQDHVGQHEAGRRVTFGGGNERQASISPATLSPAGTNSRATRPRFISRLESSASSSVPRGHGSLLSKLSLAETDGTHGSSSHSTRPSDQINIVALKLEAASAIKEAGLRKKQQDIADVARAETIAQFETPTIVMWSTNPGSRIYDDLFPSYVLPDGSLAKMYRHRKTRVDEVQLNAPKLGVVDSLHSTEPPPVRGADETAKRLLKAIVSHLPLEPVYPPVMRDQGLPPRPKLNTLPHLDELSNLPCTVSAARKSEAVEADTQIIVLPNFRTWARNLGEPVLKANKKSGLLSCQSEELQTRPSEGLRRASEPVGAAYMPFAGDIFDADWKRCCEKDRFSNMVSKFLPAKEGSEDDLKASIRKRYADLVRIFDYYATVGTGDSFSISIVPWGQLGMDTPMADETSATCKLADLDRIFTISNFEEEKGTQSAAHNPDKALLRFEYLEALIRVAHAKFLEKRGGKPKKKAVAKAPAAAAKPVSKKVMEAALAAEKAAAEAPPDPDAKPKNLIEACCKLVDRVLVPHVPPEALMDTRMFRERLYTTDVDLLFQTHRKVLEAIFNHYKNLFTVSDSHRLDMPEWLELLADAGLHHKHFSQREAKLAFVWSRMRYYDELASKRAHTLTRSIDFLEFLEALGRTADMVGFPSVEELQECGYTSQYPTVEYLRKAQEANLLLSDRPSAKFDAPKTRPLDIKIEQVIEVVVQNLLLKFSARDVEQLKTKLRQQRSRAFALGKSN